MTERVTGVDGMRAEDHDLTLSLGTRPGGPWAADVHVLSADIQSGCRSIKEDLYGRVVDELAPDVVVAMDSGPDPGVAPDAFPDTPPHRPTGTRRRDRRGSWRTGGRSCSSTRSPRSRRTSTRWGACAPPPTPRSAASAPTPGSTGWSGSIARRRRTRPTCASSADTPNVRVLDVDRLVCPLVPVCDPIVDGQYVWWDGQHVAHEWALRMAEPLFQALVLAGVLPG